MKRLLALLLCLTLAPCAAWAANGLKSGASGAEVVKLQTRLEELGLFSGKTDGIYGQQTSAAMAEAQRLLIGAGYSVSQNGEADGETLSLLYDLGAQDALTTLCVGSKNRRVKELQTRLIDLKLLDGSADGAFGAATEKAVERLELFLKEQGLTDQEPTGKATPALLQWLNDDLSQYGFRAPIYYDFSKPESLAEDYLYAKACVLMDGPSGEVLFQVNAREKMYPASTTKIMTLMVSLDKGGLEQTVTIPKEAKEVPADSSLVPVYPGEQMKKLDLLYGLMLRSGNDAANAVAVLDGGSVDSFVEWMNQKAEQLGMTDTHFANPHGYHDPNHYTTAYDMALLTRQGLTNPTFCQIVTCLSYTLPATEKREALVLKNTHEIFDAASPYYLPYAAGVKSGYTSPAGFCYVGAAQKDGRTLIVVLMNAPSRNRAWMDLKKLFEYGFSHF